MGCTCPKPPFRQYGPGQCPDCQRARRERRSQERAAKREAWRKKLESTESIRADRIYRDGEEARRIKEES